MSPANRIERDVRRCTLDACHRVGLYPRVRNPNDARFLQRPCRDLIVADDGTCPIHPPYSDSLMTFRQVLRERLVETGYDVVRIYLQRLCTEEYAWNDFCRYHADRL